MLASLGTFPTDPQLGIVLRISHSVTFGDGTVQGQSVLEILEKFARSVRETVVPSLQGFAGPHPKNAHGYSVQR